MTTTPGASRGTHTMITGECGSTQFNPTGASELREHAQRLLQSSADDSVLAALCEHYLRTTDDDVLPPIKLRTLGSGIVKVTGVGKLQPMPPESADSTTDEAREEGVTDLEWTCRCGEAMQLDYTVLRCSKGCGYWVPLSHDRVADIAMEAIATLRRQRANELGGEARKAEDLRIWASVTDEAVLSAYIAMFDYTPDVEGSSVDENRMNGVRCALEDFVNARAVSINTAARALPNNERTTAGEEWQDMSTCPDSDDLLWFCRGDTFDGPRTSTSSDVDYWDFWCYAMPPFPFPEDIEPTDESAPQPSPPVSDNWRDALMGLAEEMHKLAFKYREEGEDARPRMLTDYANRIRTIVDQLGAQKGDGDGTHPNQMGPWT